MSYYRKKKKELIVKASLFSFAFKVFSLVFRSRRLWSCLHGLGWIGAISQVTLN
jgi:hypothetical protein